METTATPPWMQPETRVESMPEEEAVSQVTIMRSGDMEAPLLLTLLMGAALTGALYLGLAPLRDSYLGVLLLERGLTQYASVFLAASALAFLGVKSIRILAVWKALSASGQLEAIQGTRNSPARLQQTRDSLIRAGGPIALRRARALQAYLLSHKRSLAATQAEEDAVQAQAAMESSYAVPRVMIWAIPLMGFIGTVVGISSAVTGFSGFLQTAEEIDQVKEGIGTVTTGLAVAFDTTLVALALSVLVMILLVMVERLEGRILLAMEADISDAVISRLPEADTPSHSTAALDRSAVAEAVKQALSDEHSALIQRSVHEAIQANLPRPEEIVAPAQEYLRTAAFEIAEGMRGAASAVGEAAVRVRQFQHDAVAQLHAQQEELRTSLARRDEASSAALHAGMSQLSALAQEILTGFRSETQQLAVTLNDSTASIAEQLARANKGFDERIGILNRLAEQTSEAIALEQSLARTLRSLEDTSDLRLVLSGVRTSLEGLNPAIERLAQPRRIMLVETDDGHLAEVGNAQREA